MSTTTSSNRSLYITLQYLRTENRVHKHHWGLYATGDQPPRGTLYHATDLGRAPLDLLYESKTVSNPMRSVSTVVCLKVADVPSVAAIHDIIKRVPVMRRESLPPNERMWTCRVWVKEALKYLHGAQFLRLPADPDRIEGWCLHMADTYMPYRISRRGRAPEMPQPRIYNYLRWMSGGSNRTIPMEVDPTQPTRPSGPSRCMRLTQWTSIPIMDQNQWSRIKPS